MLTITLRNLTTGYRTHHGLKTVNRDIDASLRSGELTCLLGPTGAGKSTLLRTLSGFSRPVSGVIELMGSDIASYTPDRLSRLVGVVLTERLMVSEMTVSELVGMGRAPYTGFWGRLTAADRRIVADSLAAVGVSEMAGRAIQTLSDGERQKVMIAKALAQQTPVILLDEPTAFLDYPSKVEIMRLLHRLARDEQKTIFLSTHDLELALRTADTVWLIDKELGVATGTPEDLALDGSLGRYFERPGIEFDPAEGMFRISMSGDGASVCIEGTGPGRILAERALRRAGFRPGAEGIPVTVTEAGYMAGDKKCATIRELIMALSGQ